VIVTYAVVFTVACVWNRRNPAVFKSAVLSWTAALAGISYAATELVKFYQQVTINPVSVVVTVQAMTKPVILVLSALIWKERTVKEQLAWGLAAFVITLPLFIPQDMLEQFLPFMKEDGVVSPP
jgi:drug/metabolite transporter (DMT)-like permease